MWNINLLSLRTLAIAGAVALFAPINSPLHAQEAKCDPLPKVEWWSQSHAKVNATVRKSYKGDWVKYIKRWEDYRKRMQKTFEAKSVAVVKSRGIKMQGPVLEAHIKNIDERLAVLRCLQKAATNVKSKETQSKNSELVAEVSDKKLQLEIVAQCKKGDTQFQVTNLGEIWPKLASINIYRTKDNSLVSRRRMKLRNSQQITFKIPQKKATKGAELGIWIEPTWTKRAFNFDAKIRC